MVVFRANKCIAGATQFFLPAILVTLFRLFSLCPAAKAQSPGKRVRELDTQGDAAARGGHFAEAIADYQQALVISPRDADTEIGLAESYRSVHNYEEAKSMLERAAQQHLKNAAPLAALGDLEIELQTYGAAVEHLRAALALKPDDEFGRIRLAVAYKSQGNDASALAQIAKVLAADPKNALAFYERAQIYSDQNQNGAALRDAQKAVDLQPNAAGRLLLATILLRPETNDTASNAAAKRCSNAVKTLESLMPDRSNDSETLFLLSRAYQCGGRDADAQKTLAEFETASKNDRALKENQTEAKHLVQQADEAAMKNDFHVALGLLQQALVKDPAYGAAYSQMAKLYYSAGDMEKASDAIAKALERDPYQPDFLYVKGKILEKQGKLDDALLALERTTLVNPKESDAFFEMGAIYEQRNDRERALAAYRRAIELSPDDPDYKKALEAMK